MPDRILHVAETTSATPVTADLRGTIGARGRQRIIDRWSWKHTAAKTVEQYRIRLERAC